MLYIRIHERMTYITVRGLDQDQVGAFSRTLQYRILLSWDLLDWINANGISCSFTNFITTPELSGPLYIDPDIYHTQITEYLLQTIYQPSPSYPHILNPVWSFGEHLPYSLPTEVIFSQLRSIPEEYITRGHSTGLVLDTLEIITKWLQGLGPERPSDLYNRFQRELLRYKALHQL